MEQILQYYSVPTVSARNALYHLHMNKAHGFAEEDVHCGVHPNPLGHRCGAARAWGCQWGVRTSVTQQMPGGPWAKQCAPKDWPPQCASCTTACSSCMAEEVAQMAVTGCLRAPQVLRGPGHRRAAGPRLCGLHACGGHERLCGGASSHAVSCRVVGVVFRVACCLRVLTGVWWRQGSCCARPWCRSSPRRRCAPDPRMECPRNISTLEMLYPVSLDHLEAPVKRPSAEPLALGDG